MKRILLFCFVMMFVLASVSAFNQSGIISYYRLDEPSGTVIIDSFGSNNGTNVGATVGVPGIINTAYEFDGGSDYADSSGFSSVIGDYSFQFWLNASDTGGFQMLFDDDTDGAGDRLFLHTSVSNDNQFGYFDSDSGTQTFGVSPTLNVFQHIVFVFDSSEGEGRLYIDSVLQSTTPTYTAQDLGNNITLGASEQGKVNTWGGDMDEVMIMERVITQAEIIQLYNGGAGLDFLNENISVTLDLPVNDTIQSGVVIFNASYIVNPSGFNLTNSTLLIWNSTGDLFFSEVNTITNTTNFTSNSVSNLSIDDYEWNVLACITNSTDDICELSQNNNTFEWIPFEEIGQTFNTPVVETSNETFRINLTTLSGFNLQSATLIYNGTTFTGSTKTEPNATTTQFTIDIAIPAGQEGFSAENRTFFWNITITNEATGLSQSFNSSESEQLVNELLFGICGGALDVPMLNFTMFNEENSTQINATLNATTFQASFNVGSSLDNLLKNVSVDNITVAVSEFDFCTDNGNNTLFINMQLSYTAVGFADKQYFIVGGALTNNTNEISLFLLPDALAIEFFITVEQDLFPLAGATVNIQKFFVGEGLFKTVEIKTTDNDGKFVAFLDLNKDYRFTVIKDGQVLIIDDKSSICEAAPCELSISIGLQSFNLLSGLDFYATNVLFNISFNPVTEIVTFDFIDVTGLATSFRMLITKTLFDQPGEVLSDQQLFTSSGTMTFNMSGETGDFKVDLFISRSPFQFISSFFFQIADFAGELGFIGILFAFFLIITIIFGFALKPSMLVLSIPLALLTTKYMGILSIGFGAIIAFTILAVVTFFALSK